MICVLILQKVLNRMENSFIKIIGPTLKRIRLEKGLSQKRVGELSGIGQSNLSRMENGEASPTLITLGRWADALGVDIKFIDKKTNKTK